MGIFNTNSDYYLSNVIFFNRNKAFGAYILRKGYTRNIAIALIIANFVFIVSAILLFILLQNKPEEVELYKIIDYKTSDFSLTEVKIPRIEQKKPAAQTEATSKENAPLVVKEDEPEKKLDEKTDEKAKPETKSDEDSKTESTTNGEADQTLKSISSDTAGTNLYSDEIFMKVEIPAEFPGGPLAFGKFIGENIKYPEYATKNKIDGIIYVHMIVNNDGTISELKIYKGIEESCNNEVLRIMKISPKWIPARQKAKFVRQRMIVPIRFRSQQ